MAKNAKIKPYHKKSKSQIAPTESDKLKENIIFSYKYLDFTNNKFQFPKNKPDYFVKMIERFKEKGFKNLPQQLQDGEDYQFSISKVKYGRIHGVLLDNIFYIVWFDHAHNLLP